MAKVTVTSTIVGTPEEVEKYGGQVPPSLKKFEKKMSQGEIDSYKGKITVGTVMEVSDQRRKELLEAGVIEGSEKLKAEEAKTAEKKKGLTITDKTSEKDKASGPARSSVTVTKAAKRK